MAKITLSTFVAIAGTTFRKDNFHHKLPANWYSILKVSVSEQNEIQSKFTPF